VFVVAAIIKASSGQRIYFGCENIGAGKCQSRFVTKIVSNPCFDPCCDVGDIALLRVDSPFNLGSRLPPVDGIDGNFATLDQAMQGEAVEWVTMMGWGSTCPNAAAICAPQDLHELAVPVSTQARCKQVTTPLSPNLTICYPSFQIVLKSVQMDTRPRNVSLSRGSHSESAQQGWGAFMQFSAIFPKVTLPGSDGTRVSRTLLGKQGGCRAGRLHPPPHLRGGLTVARVVASGLGSFQDSDGRMCGETNVWWVDAS
jgi:hypothetical protein